MSVKIAVLDDFQGVALNCAGWSGLKGRAEITVFHDNITDQKALAERLNPFDVICVMRERTPINAALLAQLPALRLLVTTGYRNASIDAAAAERQGVRMAYTASTTHAPTEMAWALILGALRSLPAESANMRSGAWQTTLGGDLSGATLGIVGLGKIGAAMARIGAAFGMEVIAWSQNLTPERAAQAGARAVSKAELFKKADVVTLHLVLSERTRGVVGVDELALMKSTAWLVNTSRGPLVDEPALIAALERERIGGAAIDVYDIEPPPADHPLRRLPNVLATPHLGFVTRKTYEIMYGQTVEAITRWLDDKS